MANPLIDKNFLKQLDEFPQREIYVKIIALTLDEHAIEEIQGRATAGSINIDGSSAVRRSCSLTLIVDNLDLRDYYWGLNNKFKVEIGMRNFINSDYPEIIWFPQGVYLITGFNTSQSPTGYTVSISGKDKMTLLNGEIGGKIHANSTRFDIIEEYDKDNNRHEIKIPIREMIQELVHEYGNEPLHNIIINDVDDYGVELLEYRGSTPLYVFQDYNSNEIKNIAFGTSLQPFITTIKNLYTGISNLFTAAANPTSVSYGDGQVKISKINFGDTAGYRLTELIYPGELVVSAGETVTGVLDKIKTMLNDFEYFYDLNGRFIFQRKPVYTVKSWTPLRTDYIKNAQGKMEYFAESMTDVSPVSYRFYGDKLLTQISNTPNYSNIKNDFSIWGKRTGISGAEIPIHLRYAIQKKPTIYKTIADVKEIRGGQKSNRPRGTIYNSESCDWRELIYQMALDYRKANHDNDFEYRMRTANPELAPDGKTNFEQYYVDMEAFWRQLYDPGYIGADDENYDARGWNKNITDNPSALNFWIDFLSTEGDIGRYGVDMIGDRSQIVNDDKIKAVYFKETPLIIYYNADSEEAVDTDRSKTGYTYISVGDITSLFSISSQGKSAQEELENQLQNYTYASEAITLTALPIYYLEPNTRIEVTNDENVNVNGEYIISKITIPVSYNGTMSISATKDPQTLL